MNSFAKTFAISLCLAALSAIGCSAGTPHSGLSITPEVGRLITDGDAAWKASNLELAEQKFLDAATQAKHFQDEVGFAAAHVGLGLVSGKAGKHNEAIERFSIALHYFKSNDLRNYEAEVWHNIGFAEDELGNTILAIFNYDQALSLWDELLSVTTGQDKVHKLQSRAATLFLKASAHEKLRHWLEAVEYYRRAARDDEAAENDDGAGVALWLAAGIAERELKDQEQAIGLYADAVPRLLVSNNQRAAAYASLALGQLYLEAGEYRKAEKILLESVKLGESLDLPNVTFRANYRLANAFEATGDLPQALTHFEAVIDLLRQGKEKDDEIYLYALREAGTLYRVLGKYELSIEHLRAAAVKYREKQDLKMEGAMLAQLAELHFWIADFDTALDLYKRALGLFRKYKPVSDDDDIRMDEVQILAALGEVLSVSGKGQPAEPVNRMRHFPVTDYCTRSSLA